MALSSYFARRPPRKGGPKGPKIPGRPTPGQSSGTDYLGRKMYGGVFRKPGADKPYKEKQPEVGYGQIAWGGSQGRWVRGAEPFEKISDIKDGVDVGVGRTDFRLSAAKRRLREIPDDTDTPDTPATPVTPKVTTSAKIPTTNRTMSQNRMARRPANKRKRLGDPSGRYFA